MIDRIAILGTGLLGTSVGLALRAAGFKGASSAGTAVPSRRRLALGWAQSTRSPPTRLKPRARARSCCSPCPSYATLDFMEKLAPVLGPDQLVTDVGSTKRLIAEAAARLYNTPERAAFLPGHPMAGKERGGAALADANLFRGAVGSSPMNPGGAAFARQSCSAELVNGLARALGRRDGLQRPSISIPHATTSWSHGSAICRSLRPRR